MARAAICHQPHVYAAVGLVLEAHQPHASLRGNSSDERFEGTCRIIHLGYMISCQVKDSCYALSCVCAGWEDGSPEPWLPLDEDPLGVSLRLLCFQMTEQDSARAVCNTQIDPIVVSANQARGHMNQRMVDWKQVFSKLHGIRSTEFLRCRHHARMELGHRRIYKKRIAAEQKKGSMPYGVHFGSRSCLSQRKNQGSMTKLEQQ